MSAFANWLRIGLLGFDGRANWLRVRLHDLDSKLLDLDISQLELEIWLMLLRHSVQRAARTSVTRLLLESCSLFGARKCEQMLVLAL